MRRFQRLEFLRCIFPIVGTCALLCLPSGFAEEPIGGAALAQPVGLETLRPAAATQGFSTLQVDKSVSSAPLSVGGKRFARGLGTHAVSEVVYDLDGRADRFACWVGMDDALTNRPDVVKVGSVTFQVLADGVKLFDSGVMHIGDPARRVDVSLAGRDELRLVVTDGGDGIHCDHADWCDPVLTVRPAAPRVAVFHVRGGDLDLAFDARGRVAEARAGKKVWPVSATTALAGFTRTGEVSVVKLAHGGHAFVRTMADAAGRVCTVTDRFIPTDSSVRWETEIASEAPNFSVPIMSRLTTGEPGKTLVWAPWTAPDTSGAPPTDPALMALALNGKAVNPGAGAWSDPLVAVPFANHVWPYGCITEGSQIDFNHCVSIPMVSFIDPVGDAGLSLVLSLDDPILTMTFGTGEDGSAVFTRKNHRLGGGKPVVFHADLVSHKADFRGGLGWMADHQPAYFSPANPKVYAMDGCGAYSGDERDIDVEKFRKMSFRVNWKLSDDFPYMGMFIPPVKDMDERWERSCSEPASPDKPSWTSCRRLNDYARRMKDNGFFVLSYFNATEFGKNMAHQPVPAELAASPDLWKNPQAYLKTKLPGAILNGGVITCYNAWGVDAGDPAYREFLLEQAARHIRYIPDAAGICIDRTDWLWHYNRSADDGVSFVSGRPARSLAQSWHGLMARLGPLMHKAGKAIYINNNVQRMDATWQVDGIYTEFGQIPGALNVNALMCVRRPAIAWTYNATLRQPGPDGFMQRHLHMGIYPTAPYTYNNHCLNPEPLADETYIAYGPLLDAMRGKKWVLAEHCVETATPGVKVNLFEVPGGYALPVTFAGAATSAAVAVRNIPNLKKLKAVAVHPGKDAAVAVASIMDDGVLRLNVPLVRGCAMVKLTK